MQLGAMHENAVSALHRGSRIGARSVRRRLGPWLLIDADTEQAFLNVAVVIDPVVDPASAVEQARRWFSARGRRFCYLLRETDDAAVIDLLVRRGASVDHRLPALLMDPLATPEPAPIGLEVTDVRTPSELAIYAAIGGEEQGLPDAVMRAIAHTAYGCDGFSLLVGRLDDTPVATSLALVTDRTVGVYNVNVLPGARRRGIGTAMTWAAIERGRRNACHQAFLESTPMSHRLYERMGFVTRYAYLQIAG